MMKLTGLSLALLLALHGPAALAEQAAPAPLAAEASLAGRIDAAIAPAFRPGEPGATVIVVKDGQTVLRKAYGEADAVKHIPMTPDMALRLGSITKQFTAAAILLLEQDGKLARTDEITRFFPDYPTHGKRITIEHLLTHTSGIVSFTGLNGYERDMAKDQTTAQMIARFKDKPLEFEPGTRFAYNNSGYFLLGAIIEKVSGLPYATFLEQRIFIPLGMHSTAYEGHDRGQVKHAAGHTRAGKGYGYAEPLSMTQPHAAGALVSTVDDLARWDAAMAEGKLIKGISWQDMARPYRLASGKSTGYGYGVGEDRLGGTLAIAHGGDINGFSTYALRVPDQNVYVAVLTNSDSGITSAEKVAQRAALLAIGKELPPPRPK
ncbi:MAG: serine hydrolase domain-containing protein [Gammaproteobacteria bacterium]